LKASVARSRRFAIQIAGDPSSLQAIDQNAGGAPGGTDYCRVINIWD